jgi:hypothetical protein
MPEDITTQPDDQAPDPEEIDVVAHSDDDDDDLNAGCTFNGTSRMPTK